MAVGNLTCHEYLIAKEEATSRVPPSQSQQKILQGPTPQHCQSASGSSGQLLYTSDVQQSAAARATVNAVKQILASMMNESMVVRCEVRKQQGFHLPQLLTIPACSLQALLALY